MVTNRDGLTFETPGLTSTDVENCDHLVVGDISERCSNFDLNLSTSRIEPFWVDQNLFSFLVPLTVGPSHCPGMPESHKAPYLKNHPADFLAFFSVSSPRCCLANSEGLLSRKTLVFYKIFFSSFSDTKMLIKNF